MPTLLSYAGVEPPPKGQMSVGGLSRRVLAGTAALVHQPSEPIGYEAAGGAALYRGDMKLVQNVPPYGDGKWRLYDLADNPTETDDSARHNRS